MATRDNAGLSLKGRALAALSRREYSRQELARKLSEHAESLEQLEALLDTLEREKWLSNERFAESLVRRKAVRYGTLRVKQELAAHGLDPELVSSHVAELRGTELERALGAWQRKFQSLPGSQEERAKQGRFLAARGFSADVIQRVLSGRWPEH
jgi:regulatory protein